jgi:intergrase/recombinase
MPRVDYRSQKEVFIRWLQQIKGLSPLTIKQRIRHLDKFAQPVSSPSDILEVFCSLKNRSQKRHLANGYRSLFRFYEAQGLASNHWLDVLRANLPKIKSGIDINVPAEKDIRNSLKRLGEMKREKRVFALYNMLLDSGLRLVEGVKLFNELCSGNVELEKHDGFYVIPLAEFRGTKTAYYAFISDYSLKLVKKCIGEINYKKTMGGIGKHLGVISYKYLRKFAFDTMTSEKLNIPESVADFIEGRTPKTIGARHYMQLKRKAIQFYSRYSKYIRVLRMQTFEIVGL